jgi:flagellar hook protein FlgE
MRQLALGNMVNLRGLRRWAMRDLRSPLASGRRPGHQGTAGLGTMAVQALGASNVEHLSRFSTQIITGTFQANSRR